MVADAFNGEIHIVGAFLILLVFPFSRLGSYVFDTDHLFVATVSGCAMELGQEDDSRSIHAHRNPEVAGQNK